MLAASALAHFHFGPAREIAREIPGLNAVLEEREWKAQMIADIPDDASVAAGLGFLPHLAKREKLVSLHHILKGLKTAECGRLHTTADRGTWWSSITPIRSPSIRSRGITIRGVTSMRSTPCRRAIDC
ncbi:MAG: hypothetical protein WDN28_25435 [Chthoniobacter sp.]